jgi:hypothetical protein
LYDGYDGFQKGSLRVEPYCFCKEARPKVVRDPNSPLYKQYIASFVEDMKLVYRVNGWPYHGLDDEWDVDSRRGKTIDEVMAEERKKLRPWGGPWGYKWPKLDLKPQLFALSK